MKRGLAFLISFVIIFLLFIDINYIKFLNNNPNLNKSENQIEKTKVLEVIDGDTLKIDGNRTIRLLNINSPEKDSILAYYSYNYLKEFEGKEVFIDLKEKDKYNRTLARLFSLNETYLNLVLVKEGLSLKFMVDKAELKSFAQAEKYAVAKNKGIWKKSPYSGCFNISLDQKSEKVIILNFCKELDLEGYKLRDESRKEFLFPSIKSDRLVLSSFEGDSNSTHLFWNTKNVWNDDQDTLYLFDNYGRIAYYLPYGYPI